jgi:cell division protein FtsQ
MRSEDFRRRPQQGRDRQRDPRRGREDTFEDIQSSSRGREAEYTREIPRRPSADTRSFSSSDSKWDFERFTTSVDRRAVREEEQRPRRKQEQPVQKKKKPAPKKKRSSMESRRTIENRNAPKEKKRAAVPRGRRPAPEKRARPGQKKPMSPVVRKIITFLLIAVVVISAVLLGIFLLFRISTIEVTGDTIYATEDVLRICGYEEGENLVFATKKPQEEALEKQLPYVGKAEIRKHLPGTLEIYITEAKVSACLEYSGGWLYVSEEGKILEQNASPKEGVLQVKGITPESVNPGDSIAMENQDLTAAYQEIVKVIGELEAESTFTLLDLSDLYDIKLWYEDRVEFLLGSFSDLTYKIKFGYSILQDTDNVGEKEYGTLDLSLASDVKKSTFTATTSQASTVTSASETSQGETSSGSGETSQTEGDTTSSQPEGETGETSQDTGTTSDGTEENGETGDDGTTDGSDEDTSDRGGDIPDSFFTGEAGETG